MTNKNEESLKKLREELAALRERNLLLDEKLQLQETSWLYSHHLSLSLFLGIIYSVIIGIFTYFLEYSLSRQAFYTGMLSVILVLFVYLGIPMIAILPPIILLKAPRFTFNSLRTYLVSFLFFGSLILYMDPMHRVAGEGLEKLSNAVPVAVMQSLMISLVFLFVPQLAKRCGYRLVLGGSASSFEVDANIAAVSKQLNRLEEDFNVFLDRSNSAPDRLYFAKAYEKEKRVFQFFLMPKENKTDVVIVAHSIRNDIPMRAEPEEVRRIGRIFMKWLEVSGDFVVHETEKKTIITKAVEESKKTFYRHPTALPSKRVVVEFLSDHLKDIAIIISLVIAVLAWLFPYR